VTASLDRPAATRTGDSIRIELDAEEELFAAPAAVELIRGSTRLRSGIDELLSELAGRGPRTVARVTVVLPPDAIGPDCQRRLAAAVSRYCAVRLRETENDLRATLRDTRRALLVGIAVLIVGLALSGAVLESGLPHAIRTLFGDGLFVVMAWVGAWYPLDVFIHQTRPQRQAIQLLEAAADLELVVSPPGQAARDTP
jgi:hypothetical protein